MAKSMHEACYSRMQISDLESDDSRNILSRCRLNCGLIQCMVFEKIYMCLFIPYFTRDHVITYTNDIHKKNCAV